MDSIGFAWIMFYIAAGIIGIFMALYYIASKMSETKKSRRGAAA